MSDRPDVRIPADPEDRQTTEAKAALPPQNFNVVKGSTFNLITITDRQIPTGRGSTVSYRVYFTPEVLSPRPAATTGTRLPTPVSNPSNRAAARKIASLVTTVDAPGLGTVITYNDAANFGVPGYYFCVGVNRYFTETNPENMVFMES